MKSFNADVCMMAYVLLFVPQEVRDVPTYGTFQYHPSLCPEHRGPSSINWPIAMGKTRTGLSIFWPNDGLDEGTMMLQKTCEIGPDETLGDVYFKKLFPMGVDAMIEGLDLVKAGVIIKHDQRLEDGAYESWFGKAAAEIDWSKPVADVYNIIRAANPAPGAWTTIAGRELKIYDSVRVDGRGTAGDRVSGEVGGVTRGADGGRRVCGWRGVRTGCGPMARPSSRPDLAGKSFYQRCAFARWRMWPDPNHAGHRERPWDQSRIL